MDAPIARMLRRRARRLPWTPPTSTEIGVVIKSALAGGLAWWIANLVTGIGDPMLAPLSAIVVVQVSVRASMKSAIQRTLAVVIGVLAALAIGDALTLNGITIVLIVAGSLSLAEFVLRMPPSAARQVPTSVLVVLAAVNASNGKAGWSRALDTLLGGAVGVAVSLVLPASRLVDARQTINRLAESLSEILEEMGNGLQQVWSTEQTEFWRQRARVTRERLVDQAVEAVGNGREAARWNVRDRRHVVELTRFEEVMPRLERTAIGVSVIARGLDDHTRLINTTHRAMPSMGALLVTLGGAVRATVNTVLGTGQDADVAVAMTEVRRLRDVCMLSVSRRARLAIEHALENESETGHEALDETADFAENEWLNYAALLVQVDRIVADLNAPLPA